QAPLTQIDGDTQLGPVISLQVAPSAAGARQVPVGEAGYLKPLHARLRSRPPCSQSTIPPETSPHGAPGLAKVTCAQVDEIGLQNTACAESQVSVPGVQGAP